MQVRKFEARSMKEALEMVKNQLGPEAIILAAKDNSRGFGLSGHGSVEITAAVAEDTLQRKRFVESRLRDEDRDKIQKSPARVQRQFIESMVGKYTNDNAPRRGLTSTRYIDIDDSNDSASHAPSTGSEQAVHLAPIEHAGERVKTAAQRAWNALNAHGEWREPKVPAVVAAPTAAAQASPPTEEIQALRKELAQLKTVINDFQKVPQHIIGQHPGSDFGLPYEFASTFEKLQAAGMSSEIIAEILAEAQKQMPPVRFKNKALIDGWVAKRILDTTKIVGDIQGTRVQIFAGPPGSGKTASLVKLASHYVINAHKKVALISTDFMKVGASDQLRIYAQILNVPFAVVRSAQDWDYVLQQLSGFDYILCDCPGLGLKSLEEIQLLKNLMPKKMDQVTLHLVLNSTSKDQDLNEIGRRYKSVQFKDVIFTCLDDSVQQGTIYNFVKRFDVPLHSFGIGSRVPEDFEMATRERVVDLIFKLSKVKKEG